MSPRRRPSRPVERDGQGSYRVTLGPEERSLLQSLPGQLVELLTTSPADPSLRRLFPPAYGGAHAELEAEYQRYMRDDLDARHRQALEVLAATAGAEALDEEQLSAWLAALNQLRLVLGTRLDLSEDTADQMPDPADPDAGAWHLYHYLSYLQDAVIDALAGE